jgi:hypothetical protein
MKVKRSFELESVLDAYVSANQKYLALSHIVKNGSEYPPI